MWSNKMKYLPFTLWMLLYWFFTELCSFIHVKTYGIKIYSDKTEAVAIFIVLIIYFVVGILLYRAAQKSDKECE